MWLVCVCRETAFEGIRFFLPLFIASRGEHREHRHDTLPDKHRGHDLPMIGGRIADRFGRRKVTMAAMAAAPFSWSRRLDRRDPVDLLYMVGNALLQGLLPVTGAAAQEMAPEARSTAASMVWGSPSGWRASSSRPSGPWRTAQT